MTKKKGKNSDSLLIGLGLGFLIAIGILVYLTVYAKTAKGSFQLSSKSVIPKVRQEKKMDANKINSPATSMAISTKLSPDELSSLTNMTQTLFQFTQADAKLQDLIRYLESTGQKPAVVNNSNADTGEMAIVRTGSPLVGTRYFHAQYFADENQKGFVQHMSFEMKPGSKSMEAAVSAVQNNFQNLPDPTTKTPDFMQWNLPGGQILWVKKMAANDLKDNPFNAYTPDDVGTVQVAVELEIHEGHDGHEHSH